MSDTGERYRVNTEEVAAKVIDGEAIIINLTTGVYYSMDGVGGRVWSLLEAHHSVDAIVEAICAGYSVPADVCRADVARLTSQLLEETLLATSTETPTTPIPPANGDLLDYVTPDLSIYRDMDDLLALDPPVPGLEPIPWDDSESPRDPA
jgi:hypothetical protein